MTTIDMIIPYSHVQAFYSRMMAGGEYYSDGNDLIYSKKVAKDGVIAEFRVETRNRRFFPSVSVTFHGEKISVPVGKQCLYRSYAFGEAVKVNITAMHPALVPDIYGASFDEMDTRSLAG